MNKPRGFSGVRTLQFQEELDGFIELMLKHGVTSYLEIGAHHGDTLHQVGLRLPKGSRLVGVDLPGATAGGYVNSGRSLKAACEDLRSRGQEAHWILGDSTDLQVVKRTMEYAPFDCVFIDGSHTAEDARKDWANYCQGMVGIHDIRKANSGVPVLWDEIKASHPKIAEISIHAQKRGIGVVWLD